MMDWHQKLQTNLTTALSEGARHILLGSSVVLLSVILANGLRSHAVELSQRWTRWLPYADSAVVRGIVVDSTTIRSRGSPAEVLRLEEQMQQIAARANLHLEIMKYFYGRYFASVTMAALLAVAAGLCLVHITKVGWSNANRYVMTVFVMTAGLAIFYQLSPRLYQQQQNITANKALYLGYVALSDEVRTYVVTGLMAAGDSVTSLGLVLREVDQRLLRLSDLPIGFDEGQVPDYTALPGLTEGTR